MPSQFIKSKFQGFSMNVNGNIQTRKLWFFGLFFGYVPAGNDFYEPRKTGYSWDSPRRLQFNPWMQTNSAKKYYLNLNYFLGLRSLFHSPNQNFNLYHRFRFSDKFSLSHSLYINPTDNDAGFYTIYNGIPIFSRRDLRTVENDLQVNFNFSKRSGIQANARHYMSKVHPKQLYDLQTDGSLRPSVYAASIPLENQNFNIFNVDATYTLEFAPGSFINIVWKEEGQLFDQAFERDYPDDFVKTLNAPQKYSLSLKVIYYLDYLKIKNLGKKKRKDLGS
jgi:hypothetical protein